jgi:hypothetical protein
MSITIKENEKPNLAICKMNCDDGLHEKLNKYELTKFMNNHSTNLFIGKPRSGKTSLLYSFFKSRKIMKKTFHNIFLFQPSASRSSMDDKIFDVLPDDQKFDELTQENLQEVMDKIKNEDSHHNNCIIFDDMTAYLKNKETLKLLKELIFNRRHLHVSIFFLVQTWFSVEKSIRKLFSNIFCFKVSKNELEDIFEEVIEQKKELIPVISKVVFDKPYQYLFINTESQRLFKGFDELLIE